MFEPWYLELNKGNLIVIYALYFNYIYKTNDSDTFVSEYLKALPDSDNI